MLHAITVSCEVKDFAFKNHPVKNRCSDNRITQKVSPVVKAFVRGQYERFVLETVRYEGE